MSEAGVRRVVVLPSMGTLPQPRSSAHVIQNDHCVVVFGGVGRNDVLNDTHMFDTQSRRWTEVHATNPPVGRGGACHCVYDGRWYVFSGRALTHYCADLCALDFRTLQWESLRTQSVDGFFPAPRDDAGHCLWRDELLVLGGVSEDGAVLRDLWSLHLPTSTWSCPRTQGASPAATAAVSLCLWESEDTVVAFGGYDGTTFSADVTLLHLPTATWSAVDVAKVHAPRPRTHAASAIHGRHMYVVGGYAGTAPQSDCWALNLFSWAWVPISLPGSLVPRGAAGHVYFRGGEGMGRNTVLLFGGCTGGDFLNDLVSLEFSDGAASPVLTPAPAGGVWGTERPPRISIPQVGSVSPQREGHVIPNHYEQPPPIHPQGIPLETAASEKMNNELAALQRAVDGLRSEVSKARSHSPRGLSSLTTPYALPPTMGWQHSGSPPQNYINSMTPEVERRKAEGLRDGDVETIRTELHRYRVENARLASENESLASSLEAAVKSTKVASNLRRASEGALQTLISMQIEMDMIKRELGDIRAATQKVLFRRYAVAGLGISAGLVFVVGPHPWYSIPIVNAAVSPPPFEAVPDPPPAFLSGSGVYVPYTHIHVIRWVRTALRLLRIAWILAPVVWAFALYRWLGLANEGYVLDRGVRAIEALGPSFIKLAQWASTRPDLFGVAPTTALRAMTFRAPTHSYEETMKALERELGYSLHREIGDVSKGVLGSGAVAQVHTAIHYPTGLRVAVKVLHPNVCRDIGVDLDVLAAVAWALGPLVPTVPLYTATLEFSVFMRSQLDLTGEAMSLERFATNFRGALTDIRFPVPMMRLTTPGVLIETLEEGTLMCQYLADGGAKDHTAETKRRLARTGIRMFLRMIFVDNFVHGDLHPGNMLVAGDGTTLIVLDPGLVTTLSSHDWSTFLVLFGAVAAGDGKLGAKLMREKTTRGVSRCQDPDAFDRDMDLIFSAMNGSGASGFVGKVLNDVLDCVNRHGILIESNFTTLIAAIVVLEGVGRQLDPELNIFASAAPYLLQVLEGSEVAHLTGIIRQRYGVPSKGSFFRDGHW